MSIIQIKQEQIEHTINCGRSTDKFLVKLDDSQEYVFKFNKKETDNKLYLMELIVSKLMAKIEYPNFIEYKLARLDNLIGSLSINFIVKNSKELTLRDIQYINQENSTNKNLENLEHKTLSVEQIKELYLNLKSEKQSSLFLNTVTSVICDVQELCQNYNITVNKSALYTQLVNMAVVDYFFGNGDRQWENIDFLITEIDNQKYLTMTPNFDYEYFFNMYCYETFLKLENNNSFTEKDVENLKTEKFYQRILLGISDKFSSDFNKKLELINDFKNYRQTITQQDKSYFDEYSKDNAKLIVLDMIELSKKDEQLNKMISSILKLDLQEVFQEIENENEIQIPDIMKETVSEVFLDRKNLYYSLNEFVDNKNNLYINERSL